MHYIHHHHLCPLQRLLPLHGNRHVWQCTILSDSGDPVLSRSAEDEYTPPDQVKEMQQQLLAVLNDLFPRGTKVTLHYEDQ